MLTLDINENDFVKTIGRDQVDIKFKNKSTPILGEDDNKEFLEAFYETLPKIISNKLTRIIPNNFKIHEIELEIAIQGTPFGIGIAGKAVVRFGPE